MNDSIPFNFKTSKGKPGIIYKGHRYRKTFCSTVNNFITWRCLVKECAASMKTDGTNYRVVEMSGAHNHNVSDVVRSSTPLPAPTVTEVGGNNKDLNQSSSSLLDNSDLYLESLTDKLSRLESEIEQLKNRLHVLQSERDAALDRSIELDIKLLQRFDSSREVASQTISQERHTIPVVSRAVHTVGSNSSIVLLNKSVNTELISDAFMDKHINLDKIDLINSKLKNDIESLSERIVSMSISIEALEADNHALRD
jgi:hypothetical protein